MDQHDATSKPADGALPRPIVLSLEDMESVAAAGVALAAMPGVMSKIIIAGGIPPAIYMSTATMY
jgi:hypothetical protein